MVALQLLGKAIAGLPREEIVIATKVGKYKAGEPIDFTAERVTRSVTESMQRLGVDYIDIIHCHDIEFLDDMRQVCT